MDLEVIERTSDERTSKNFMNSYEASKRKNKRHLSDEENHVNSENKSATEGDYDTTPSKPRLQTPAQNQDGSTHNKKKTDLGKVFSERGSINTDMDLKPMLDEGNSMSSSGIKTAMRLCEVLDIPFESYRPKKAYYRGCGHECIRAMQILCTWTLHVQELKDRPPN